MPWSYLHSQQINQGTKKWYNSLWCPLQDWTTRRIIESLHFWPRAQCTINIFKYYLFKIMAMTLIIIRKGICYNNLLRIQGCVLVKRTALTKYGYKPTILGGYLTNRIAFQGTMGMQALSNSQLIDHNCVALRWILWDGLLVWWRNISNGMAIWKTWLEAAFKLTSNDMASDKDSRQLSMFCTPHARSAPAFLTRNLDLCKQCSSK